MRNILMLTVTLSVATTLNAGDAVPLGHPDFYPSPERPLGWRGDGTGAWPGANCVSTWNAETGENIVWKVNTPGAGLCQPIVVGEKVFVTADPNLLLCYNVHDGKLLWQTAIDHTLCMNEADRKAAREEQKFWDGKWQEYCEWRQVLTKLEERILKVSGIGPAPDSKNKDAYAAWQRSHSAALDGLYTGRSSICVIMRLVEPGDPGYEAVLQRAKNDAEVKSLLGKALAAQQANAWRKFDANENGVICVMNTREKGSAPFTQRYVEAQQKYDIWFTAGNNWFGFVSYSFATPATDGKYIYVTTANNAVAAVDLNGKIAWIVWEKCTENRLRLQHTRYVTSPRLMDGKLVVNQSGLLRVYDTTNGKKLWEKFGPWAVEAGAQKPVNCDRPNPESTSPVVGQLLLPDGKRLGIIVTSDHLWRLDDGKLLLTEKIRGTILHYEAGIMVGGKEVVRLRATNRDTVVVEPLWSVAPDYQPDMRCLSNDRYYSSSPKDSKTRGLVAYDIATGKIVWPAKGVGLGGYNSPIIAGERLYLIHKSEKSTKDRSTGHGIVCDLNTGIITAVPSPFIDKGVTDGDFGYGHTPFQQNSSPSAQANRIFFRSRGMLWCIGDPKQPFPAPKDCPAEATVK